MRMCECRYCSVSLLLIALYRIEEEWLFIIIVVKALIYTRDETLIFARDETSV